MKIISIYVFLYITKIKIFFIILLSERTLELCPLFLNSLNPLHNTEMNLPDKHIFDRFCVIDIPNSCFIADLQKCIPRQLN